MILSGLALRRRAANWAVFACSSPQPSAPETQPADEVAVSGLTRVDGARAARAAQRPQPPGRHQQRGERAPRPPRPALQPLLVLQAAVYET